MITTDALQITMQKNRDLIRGYGDKSPHSKQLQLQNQMIGYALAYMKKHNKHVARDMEEVKKLAQLQQQ